VKIGDEIIIRRNLATPNEASRTSGSTAIEPCKRHKPVALSYIDWHEWAMQQLAKGRQQSQCAKCARWYFPNEF